MSFKEDILNQAKAYGGGGGGGSDFFHFDEGVNRLRILAHPKVIAYHFFGKGEKPDVCIGIDEGCPHHKKDDKKPTIKLVTYVLDRKDNQIKLAELPLSLNYSINDLQEDQDYAFDGFPMPYDVKITHDPKNPDPKAKYRLQPSPKQEPLTEEEQDSLMKAMENMTPEEYVAKRKQKQSNPSSGEVSQRKNTPEVDPQIDPEDIPF